MFSERDASKVKFFCEALVSAYSREFSNFFLTSLSPSSVLSSLGSWLIAGIGLQANKYG